MKSKSSAKLLEIDRQTLGRPKKQDGIYLRDINAFVVEVYDKNNVDFFRYQILLRGHSLVGWRIRRKRNRIYSMPVEKSSHELCVGNAYAKPNCP